MKDKILCVFSLAATGIGVALILAGHVTDGLLAMILGELIDAPKRF